MNKCGKLESGMQKVEENTGLTTTITKDFDDTNWKQEIFGSLEFNQSNFAGNSINKWSKIIYVEYLSWLSLNQMEKIERI